jgi:hypothetical protein
VTVGGCERSQGSQTEGMSSGEQLCGRGGSTLEASLRPARSRGVIDGGENHNGCSFAL